MLEAITVLCFIALAVLWGLDGRNGQSFGLGRHRNLMAFALAAGALGLLVSLFGAAAWDMTRAASPEGLGALLGVLGLVLAVAAMMGRNDALARREESLHAELHGAHRLGMARRETERAVRESEARFRALVRCTVDAIVTTDEKGRILFWNEGAEEMFGYDEREVLGVPLASMLPDCDAIQRMREISEATDAACCEAGSHRETTGLGRDGARFPVEIAASSWSVDGFLYFSAIIRDISERVRAQTQLEASKRQAEQANRAKSQFLANMSHELRTPLNAIIGFSELGKGQFFGPLGEQYRDYMVHIHESGHHLLRIINDILDVSKLEIDGMVLNETEMDVHKVVAAAMAEVRDRAAEGRIQLFQRIGTGLPAFYGDPERFSQVLVNLLSNAVKFTPAEGEVAVDARLEGDGSLLIRVTDTGVGIEEEDIARVVEPFATGGDIYSRPYEGAGLGLHICKRLVEMQDGVLDIQSAGGAGVVVTLRFPPERLRMAS